MSAFFISLLLMLQETPLIANSRSSWEDTGVSCHPKDPPMVLGRAILMVGGIGVLEHVLKDRNPLVLKGFGYVPVSQMGYGEKRPNQDLLITVLVIETLTPAFRAQLEVFGMHPRVLQDVLSVPLERIIKIATARHAQKERFRIKQVKPVVNHVL